MDTVTVGRSPVRIPRIGLGGAPLGREIDEETSRDILDFAVSRGITLIDTAESYGGGNAHQYRMEKYGVDDVREATQEMHSSEKIIGRWLDSRKCREQVTICTKFNTGGTAARVKQALEESLERLQTDYVDLYMLHQPYPDVPIRETLEALTVEVKAGRVRSIGCSNFSTELVREARETADRHGLARIDSVQPPFSLADAGAAASLLPYCREHEIAAITYSPLAAGFLTGKYSRSREEIPRGTRFDVIPGHIDVYFSERNFHVVDQLRALATETGESMERLAMAWVFHHPGVSSVLVGARKRSHLENAIDAMSFQLSPELKQRMDHWLDEPENAAAR